MPPSFLADISQIDFNRVLFNKEAIGKCNPQRGHFAMLDAIVFADQASEVVVGYKDVRDDEFWVPGHIPGRPLFPGVLMIEAAAQISSFYIKQFLEYQGFIGFGGLDNVRFRQQVVPGKRLILIAKRTWARHRRIGSTTQAIVDGELAFEAEVIGVQM